MFRFELLLFVSGDISSIELTHMMKWHLVLNEMELVEFCLQWMCVLMSKKNQIIHSFTHYRYCSDQNGSKVTKANRSIHFKCAQKYQWKNRKHRKYKNTTVLDEVRTTHRSLNWPTVAINQCKIKRYRLLVHKVVIQFGQECFFCFQFNCICVCTSFSLRLFRLPTRS